MTLIKLSNFKRVQQWNTMARIWYLYDAKWQNPFDSAKLLVKYLMGRHKPIYHPLSDVGDQVVIINTGEIAMPNDEWINRVYFFHTGYPKGASYTLAWELHKKQPTLVMSKAIYKELGGSLLRRPAMERLHLYADENVPKEIMENVTAEIRQLRPQPKSLEKYSEEDIKDYPQLFDWPTDYVSKKYDIGKKRKMEDQ